MPDPVVVTSAAPPSESKSDGVKAPDAPVAKKTYKIPFPELGEIELPEEDVHGVLNQFAKMTAEDMKASRRMKEIEEDFKDDAKLEALLKKFGKDPEALAEAWLSRSVKAKVEDATLSPEQKRVRELEAKLEAAERKDKAAAELAAAEKLKADTATEYAKLQTLAADALKQTAIPAEFHKEPFVLQRLGAIMKRNEELQYEVSPLVLAKQLEAEIAKQFDYGFKKMTPDTLFEKLGRKGVEGLIKLYAAKMTGATPESAPAKAHRAAPRQESPEAIRRKASNAQYERAREEQKLLRQSASGRENRYYGVK